MDAAKLLGLQLAGAQESLAELLNQVNERDWSRRAFPNTNPPGFTAWHVARARDWAVQTGISGVPEVATQPRWAPTILLDGEFGLGVGTGPVEVDRIVAATTRKEVLAYSEAALQTIQEWLGMQDWAALEEVPDLHAHQSSLPRYQGAPFQAEIASWAGRPAWRYISGPCLAHFRNHVGELELVTQVLREHD